MEISTMFSQFTPLALIRGSGHRRAVQDDRRSTGPARRHNRTRTRARFQLEGLEARYLLSGISANTEFPVLTANSNPLGITRGPDGNLWFTESVLAASKIGVIN